LERTKVRKKFVVVVQCSNSQRYYLTKDDLDGPVKSEERKIAAYDKAAVVEACEAAARRRLRHPMTYPKHFWNLDVHQAPVSAIIMVEFDFAAKDGSGNEWPAHSHCEFNPDGALSIRMVAGSSSNSIFKPR
jgi:hypothetical protein